MFRRRATRSTNMEFNLMAVNGHERDTSWSAVK
jgi:hypothetical protein